MKPGDFDKKGRPFGVRPKKCRVCGTEFQPTTGFQKYCRPGCAIEGQKVTSTCEECGDEYRHPRHADRKYCSKLCANRATAQVRAGKLGRFGNGKPAPPLIKVCENCNQKFHASSKRIKTCSRSCGNVLMHKRRRETLGTPPKWHVQTKGEDGCRNCGITATHLHHIVPRSLAPGGKTDVQNNGMPLCRACHYGWHHRTVTIYADRLTANEREKAIELMSEWWVDTHYPPRPYDPARTSDLDLDKQVEITRDAGGINQALAIGCVPRAAR